MKKKNLRKVAPALLAGLLCVGGAFAWLNTSAVDEVGNHSITAGEFDLHFDNELAVIGLEAAYPMTVEEGEALTPYTFDLVNEGNINVVAKLGAVNVAKTDSEDVDDMIPADKVQVAIWQDQRAEGADEADWQKVYDGLLSDMYGDNVFGASDLISIEAGKSANFKAVAYIVEGATNEDLYGSGDEAEVRDINFALKAYFAQADGGLDHAADWGNLSWE